MNESNFHRRSIKPEERGQTMVEFAIILPLFLIFVFAIIEYGRAWGAKHSLTVSAREGARILSLPYGPGLPYGTVDEVQSAAITAVQDSMKSLGALSTAQVAAVRVNPGNDGIFDTGDDQIESFNATANVTRGDRVGISIKYKFETLAPILLTMFKDPHSSDGPPSTQSAINMGVTCYMEHE